MKRSSSSLDQELIPNDNQLHQTSINKKEEKTNQYAPRYSSILSSYSEPLTYVIHFLDSHLTFLQSFQICSLFGRIRIHGYNLSPLKFYSIYNYRTNSSLTIELISSTLNVSLQDIKSFIQDIRLTEDIFKNIQEKNGDIILIRKEPTNDLLFIKTLREHRFYKNWFVENLKLSEENQWRKLEENFHIRLIETTNQTGIIPDEKFILTANHIINRWLNEATENYPFVVLICGEKDMGKSTFIRYIINHSLNHINSIFNLTYFDCDIGQCEFTMSGCLSSININSPLFGPPCSHMKLNLKSDRLLYYGLVSPQTSPVRYLEYINKLRQLWNSDHEKINSKRSMILINTMGWGTGLGLELLTETICMCCPNIVIQLGDNLIASQDRNKMPDLTRECLLKQPVFLPYRRKIQMNDRRQKNYDEQLNYEYIKIQSAAVSNTTHSTTTKLRARDHRLLATWSYFFSSKLSRIQLSWSQTIHVFLLDDINKNGNLLPDCLEHSIVAFCSSENINQLRNSSININGPFYLSNYQNEFFECLGFGWIERCNKETQTYEIYTPINDLSNVNLLVLGAFDTPDEFQYMFSRTFVE